MTHRGHNRRNPVLGVTIVLLLLVTLSALAKPKQKQRIYPFSCDRVVPACFLGGRRFSADIQISAPAPSARGALPASLGPSTTLASRPVLYANFRACIRRRPHTDHRNCEATYAAGHARKSKTRFTTLLFTSRMNWSSPMEAFGGKADLYSICNAACIADHLKRIT